MCLLVPGKVVKIEGDHVTVDYEIEKRKGMMLETTCKLGDYVLIQGGIVVEIVPKDEAERALKSYKESVR